MRLGEHKISNEGEDCHYEYGGKKCNLGHQDYDIENVIIHPAYSPPQLYKHDIALIRLKTKITTNGNYLIN